jgi:threonine/homoserine/homoserine lactone efflux protein
MGMVWPVGPEKYVAFLTIMAAMAFMPGPANLFAVAAGMRRGAKGAVLASLGMNAGTLVWFAGSALGLMVIAATAPWIFRLAGWCGTLYIAWLGLDTLRAASRPQAGTPSALRPPGASVLRDGFVVQVTNPKALLFFTSVLPPFVELDRPMVPQLAVFALGALAFDGLFMTLYGLLGAALARRMEEPRVRRVFGLFVGCVLIAVAGLLARGLATPLIAG